MTNLDVAVRLKFLTDGQERMRAAKRDLDAFGRSFGTVSGAATGRFTSDMGRAYGATIKLGGAFAKGTTEARHMSTALRDIGAGAVQVDKARLAVDRLTAAEKRASDGMSYRAKKMAELERRAAEKRAAAGATRIGAASIAAEEAMALGAIGASAMSGNPVVIGATAAAVAAGAGFKKSISRDTAFAEVKKKVDLPEGRRWEELDKSISRTALSLGIAYDQMAKIYAAAGGSGVPFHELERFAMLAGKVTKGFNMSTENAIESLATIRARIKGTMSDLEDHVDMVNELADKAQGAVKESDILEMAGRATGAAEAAGIPFKTTMAITTALKSVGMQNEVAASFTNALSQTFGTISAGGKGAEKAADAFKMLGLSLEDVRRGMKSDPTKLILDVFRRLERSPEKAAVAVKLMGKEWWDEFTRAADASSHIIHYLELLTGTDWKGSLQRNLNTELETTKSHLERVGVMVETIGVGLSKWSLGPINAAAEKLISSFETLQSLSGRIGMVPGGFIGADERMKDKGPPIPFGERNRDLFLGRGAGPGSLSSYERRFGLGGTMRAPAGGATPSAGIVSLGRELQRQGLRVSEHPAFGGVHPVHRGRGHYEGRAIDVNVGNGVFEAANPAAAARFDALAAGLRGRGYRVIWRAPGHYNHMHVEVPTTAIHPTRTGAPRGATTPAATGGGTGAGSGAATTGKRAAAGAIHVGQVVMHGVQNLAAFRRELDRQTRRVMSDALHDVA